MATIGWEFHPPAICNGPPWACLAGVTDTASRTVSGFSLQERRAIAAGSEPNEKATPRKSPPDWIRPQLALLVKETPNVFPSLRLFLARRLRSLLGLVRAQD